MTSRKIPFSPPDITTLEKQYVMDALDSGWITTGPKVKEFERRIAAYCSASRGVCLNSATAAMEMTLRLLGVRSGDEVITSAYTYTASASVIDHVGAKIVLCDVAPGSFQMDVNALEGLITDKTKAIIPVDIGGVICDYDAIHELIESKRELFEPGTGIQRAMGRIAIIADAAHSFGSYRGGKPSGSLTDFTCFSFHAVKNLTTAEGGAVVWTPKEGICDDAIYRELMLWSLHGQTKDALTKTAPGAWEYDIMKLGYKCNMTDIAAAMGLAQLERFTEILKNRGEIASIYDTLLSKDYIDTIQHTDDNFTSNFHLYMTRIKGADETSRNKIIQRMAKMGVSANVHFKPLPLFTAYKNLGFAIDDFPNAYNQYKNEISLPIYSTLSVEDAQYVCEVFLAAIEEALNV